MTTPAALDPDKMTGFTEAERREIIASLQAVENRLEEMDRTLEAVNAFCMRLGTVLDAIGSNPMLAAMMPADVASTMMENDGG